MTLLLSDLSDPTLSHPSFDHLDSFGPETAFLFERQSRYESAREAFERQIDLSREIGDRESEASALVNLGLNLRYLGDLARAQEHLERGIAAARE